MTANVAVKPRLFEFFLPTRLNENQKVEDQEDDDEEMKGRVRKARALVTRNKSRMDISCGPRPLQPTIRNVVGEQRAVGGCDGSGSQTLAGTRV